MAAEPSTAEVARRRPTPNARLDIKVRPRLVRVTNEMQKEFECEQAPQPRSATGLARVDLRREHPHVVIGKDNYFLSADGLLMPARKDQPPPDLRYFTQGKK